MEWMNPIKWITEGRRMADQMTGWLKGNLVKFFQLPAEIAAIGAQAEKMQEISANPKIRADAAQIQNEVLRLKGEHGTLTSKVMNLVGMLGKIGIRLPGQDGQLGTHLGQVPGGSIPAMFLQRLRSVRGPTTGARKGVLYRGMQSGLLRPERGRVVLPRYQRAPRYRRTLQHAFARTPARQGRLWFRRPTDTGLGAVPIIALAAIAIPAGAVALGMMGLFKNVQRQRETLTLLERGLTPAEIEQVRKAGPLIDVGVKGLLPLLLIGGAAFMFGPRLLKAARA